MKIPGGADVNRSLTSLKKSLKQCLRQINQQAGKLLSKGDYASAESLVQIAKVVEAFRVETDSLQARWKELKGSPEEGVRAEKTPLWQYYQPILQALVRLGGEAKIAELEHEIGQQMNGRWAAGDLKTMSQGRLRWQVMVRRARKHMLEEGLLEDEPGLEWRVTPAGRKAAAGDKALRVEHRHTVS